MQDDFSASARNWRCGGAKSPLHSIEPKLQMEVDDEESCGNRLTTLVVAITAGSGAAHTITGVAVAGRNERPGGR